MKRLALSVAIAATFLGAPARAQQFSGNALYDACRSDGGVQQGFCIGYILGVIEGESFGAYAVLSQVDPDMNTVESNNMINALLGHCIPENASNEQMRDVVIRYLSDNPETRHRTARVLIWNALIDAFPCH